MTTSPTAQFDEIIRVSKHEFDQIKVQRDRYREALEFVHKALAWEERRCGSLHGVLASAIEKTRATLAPAATGSVIKTEGV